MKKFLYLFVAALFFNVSLFAQEKTQKVEVKGNCGMCKTRIEKAALNAGADKAEWDSKTKVLSLVINKPEVEVTDVQQAIAAVGHDTGEYIADDEVYANLPACCKYRDGKKKH